MTHVKTISVEEHFTTHEHLDCVRSIIEGTYPVPEVIEEEPHFSLESPYLTAVPQVIADELADMLLDLEERRLKDMDEAHIDIQVLSIISPGVQMLDPHTATAMARRINNELSGKIAKHPDRFIGLATIAPHDPDNAIHEIERAVKELGLKGVVINSHTKGEYLDLKKYWGILKKTEELNIPIYLHPRIPSQDMLKPYLDYPLLCSPILGFSAEASLHALRLMCSGAFDEFPGLKIILGHLGEALPFFMKRMDSKWLFMNTRKKPGEYLCNNFFVSTSGMFWEPPLICSCMALGADRILFGVDYPLESPVEATRFIEDASLSGVDKAKICYLNAEKLFSL